MDFWFGHRGISMQNMVPPPFARHDVVALRAYSVCRMAKSKCHQELSAVSMVRTFLTPTKTGQAKEETIQASSGAPL